jgi:phosphatidylglycerophosphatase A
MTSRSAAISPATRLSYVLATWFGLGFSRYAPGTVGSLGTLPLYFALRECGTTAYVLTTLGISLLGVWVSQRVAEHEHKEDPGLVVIDEVAGTLIALGIGGAAPIWLPVVSFGLFRLLDITKPWPIHRLEHVPPAGLGIMLDDLLAGALAGALSLAVAALYSRFT